MSKKIPGADGCWDTCNGGLIMAWMLSSLSWNGRIDGFLFWKQRNNIISISFCNGQERPAEFHRLVEYLIVLP